MVYGKVGARLGVAVIYPVDDKSRKLVVEACETLVGVRQPVIARGQFGVWHPRCCEFRAIVITDSVPS